MILSDISVRRPVLATVMSVMLILVGLIAYFRLSVREYPNIDAPIVSVRTVYPGASAEIIESQVTRPLEDSLAGIEGIRVMNRNRDLMHELYAARRSQPPPLTGVEALQVVLAMQMSDKREHSELLQSTLPWRMWMETGTSI